MNTKFWHATVPPKMILTLRILITRIVKSWHRQQKNYLYRIPVSLPVFFFLVGYSISTCFWEMFTKLKMIPRQTRSFNIQKNLFNISHFYSRSTKFSFLLLLQGANYLWYKHKIRKGLKLDNNWPDQCFSSFGGRSFLTDEESSSLGLERSAFLQLSTKFKNQSDYLKGSTIEMQHNWSNLII